VVIKVVPDDDDVATPMPPGEPTQSRSVWPKRSVSSWSAVRKIYS
jgi:hypothetical protein